MKILLAAALWLSPCAASAQTTSTGTFVHLTGRAWQTLDPANAFDAVSAFVSGNVYESLITFKSVDELDSFEPFLASEVPTLQNGLLSKDGLAYSFPIRKGVRFHDGTELSADDVRYSLLRFMLLDSEGGPAALLLRPLLGVYGTRDAAGKLVVDFDQAAKAVSTDGDKVVVRLKRPDASFLRLMASLPIATSRSWAAKNGDWDGRAETWKGLNGKPADQTALHSKLNGSGPFKLERAERDGLLLTRHDAYWRGPAALKDVVLRVVPNGALRLFMLAAGDADAGYLEGSYRAYAKASHGVRVLEEAPGRDLGEILFFGFKIDPKDNDLLGSGKLDGRGIPADFFADADVRRGFAYAFDYEAFLRGALGGQGRRAAGPFPSALAASDGEPAYRQDPAKAAAHLRKAHGGRLWDKGFVFSIAFSADNLQRQVAAEALQSGLAKLNPKFQVRLQPIPSREFYGQLETRRLPMFIAGFYADYPDPHSYSLGLVHSQGYFPKFQGFADAGLDALVEKAQAAALSERARLYKELFGAAQAKLAQIYTYQPAPMRVCREWVAGFDSRQNVNDLAFNGFPYFYAYSKKPE